MKVDWVNKDYFTLLNFVYTLFLAHTAYVVREVWVSLNLFTFDNIGHIASARAFRDGYFHTFNDTFFQGYIQNLFYPPLQDITLTFFFFFTSDFITAYYLYVSVFIFIFSLTCIYFTRNFKQTKTKITFLLLITVIQFITKHQQNFMGMGWYDVFVYGMFNQLVGLIFLLFLLDGLLNDKDWKLIVLFTVLAALSHLVVGITGFGTLIVYAALNKDKDIAKAILCSLGLIAFFLLPFLWYGEYMISNIIVEPLPLIFILALVALIPTINIKNKNAFLPISAFFLALPTAASYFVEVTEILEQILTTHYTRFTILSLWFIIIYILLLVDNLKELNLIKKGATLTSVALLTVFLLSFSYFNPSQETPVMFDEDAQEYIENIEMSGKIHTIHHDRLIDFQIDNYAAIHNPSLLFSSGLYWESTRNNNLLNSYMTTMYGQDEAMLYFHFLTNPSCQQLLCVQDQFITDFGIQKMIVSGPEHNIQTRYLNQNRQRCYQDTFGNTSHSYRFEKDTTIHSNKRPYTVYNVTPQANITNEMVDVPLETRVHTVENDPWGFMPATTELYETCGAQTQPLYLRQNHSLPSSIEQEAPASTSFEKIDRATYNITIDADTPKIFRIKLNYAPGLTLIDEQGEELPLYDATHYMVGLGKGDMQLVHKTPRGFLVGYVLTVITLLYFLWASRKPIKKQYVKVKTYTQKEYEKRKSSETS